MIFKIFVSNILRFIYGYKAVDIFNKRFGIQGLDFKEKTQNKYISYYCITQLKI